MRTAPVKAIALPAVYRANLEFQSQHPRTRVMDSPARADAEGSALHFQSLKAHALDLYNARARMLERHVQLKLEVGSVATLCLYSLMQ